MPHKKNKRKFQGGGLVSQLLAGLPAPQRQPVDPGGLTGDILEVLNQAGSQIRFGASPAEKLQLAFTGAPLGTDIGTAGRDPLAAERAASVFLATRRFGPLVPLLFNELRQGLLGLDDPGDMQRLREAAIMGASQALSPGKTQAPVFEEFARRKGTLARPPQESPGAGFRPGSPGARTIIRGQTGGKVPHKFKLSARIPAFQAGGLIGDLIGRLQGVNVQTGPVSDVARQISQFQPFEGPVGGTAQTALQNLLATGAPVDVSPITDVAQARARRTFEDLSGSINEQFGALGLGSSSARQAALAREAGRLAQGVGETGILSGVQAQESARGRQLGAFSPFFAGTGQRLGALGQAGGLFGEAAGLGLAGQIQPLQTLAGVGSTLFGPLPGTLQTPRPGGAGAPSPVAGRVPFVGGGGGAGVIPSARQFGVGEQLGARFQRGGRVDFGDFLGNLLFGRTFSRPPGQQAFAPAGGFEGGPQFTRAATPQPAVATGGPQVGRFGLSASRSSNLDRLRQFTQGADLATILASGPGFNRRAQFGAPTIGGILGPQGIQRGLMQTGNLFAQLAGAATGNAPDLASVQAQPGVSAILQALQQAGGQKKRHGGVIEGPAVPPDVVPILAQGGEVIIPVNLVSKLRKSKSKDPLVRELKELSKQSPGDKAQAGGTIPTAAGNKFLQALQQLTATGAQAERPFEIGTNLAVTGGPSPSFTQIEPGEPFSLGTDRGGFVAPTTQPSEEQKLQSQVENARARVNRLKTLQLQTNTKRGRELIGQMVTDAQGELDRAQENLQISKQQETADKQAEAQLGFAKARQQTQVDQKKQTDAVIKEKFKNVGELDKFGNVITEEQASAQAATTLRALGLPIPPQIAALEKQGQQPQAGQVSLQDLDNALAQGLDLSEEELVQLVDLAQQAAQTMSMEEFVQTFPSIADLLSQMEQ